MWERHEPPFRFLFVDHHGVGGEIDFAGSGRAFHESRVTFGRRPLATDAGHEAVRTLNQLPADRA